MGVRIRDVEDEFKGADFRDEETKLMFAYDYKNKHMLRIWGYNLKPVIYKETIAAWCQYSKPDLHYELADRRRQTGN